jgi:hypothetical protein
MATYRMAGSVADSRPLSAFDPRKEHRVSRQAAAEETTHLDERVPVDGGETGEDQRHASDLMAVEALAEERRAEEEGADGAKKGLREQSPLTGGEAVGPRTGVDRRDHAPPCCPAAPSLSRYQP